MSCAHCHDVGWVCEAHSELPWEGDRACPCGAAGAPCPACNPSDEGNAPRPPKGFKILVDRYGWRH